MLWFQTVFSFIAFAKHLKSYFQNKLLYNTNYSNIIHNFLGRLDIDNIDVKHDQLWTLLHTNFHNSYLSCYSHSNDVPLFSESMVLCWTAMKEANHPQEKAWWFYHVTKGWRVLDQRVTFCMSFILNKCYFFHSVNVVDEVNTLCAQFHSFLTL